MRVDAVDVIGQDAAPEVVPYTVASRRLELGARPLLHQGQQVVEKTLPGGVETRKIAMRRTPQEICVEQDTGRYVFRK